MQVLIDPVQRLIYDEIHGYALTAINPFFDDSSPKDQVFVDEFSCIGMFAFSRLYTHINDNVWNPLCALNIYALIYMSVLHL